MIDGQVPHRDFISVRPVLSALLQVPIVWVGGTHLFWWVRLWGWMQIGAVAWLWSGVFVPDRTIARATAFGIILLLNAHTFPVMAWHTLDGMLFCSAAVAMARHGSRTAWAGAFGLAGLACLTRQNFFFFLPFLVLGLPNWRFWPAILWSGVPPLLYLLWVASVGAFSDFVQQILATGGYLGDVLRWPLQVPALYWGMGLGLLSTLAVMVAARRAASPAGKWLHAGLLLVTGGYAAVYLWRSEYSAGSLALFGFTLMLAIVALLNRQIDAGERLLVGGALGLSWTVSISNGYNNPALMGGVLLITLWRLMSLLGGFALFSKRGILPVGGGVLAALMIALAHARTASPYEDKPAGELKHDAGKVMPGASGLFTNEVTYGALSELQVSVHNLEAYKRPYVIFTDYSAFWVQSLRPNPINCEWPQMTELGLLQRALLERLAQSIKRLPPNTVFLIHRHDTAKLWEELSEIQRNDPFYYVQTMLRSELKLVEQGRYFDVYVLKNNGP